VFADPTGLGFPIFFASACEFILTNPFFVGPLFTAFVGPDRLNRLCFRCLRQRAHDRPIVRQPLLRFCSLQRLQVVLRYPRRPALGPSRFDVAPAAIQIPPEVGFSGAGIVPAVFPPCVNRALGPRRAIVVTLHTGPVQVIRHGLSFARRSATRLTEPSHDWAGPSLNSARQRSWDSLRPSQYSLIRGSPHFCGSSPHAVIQIVRVRAR